MEATSAYKQEYLQRTEKSSSKDYFHIGFCTADDVQFLINQGVSPDNLNFFSTENANPPNSILTHLDESKYSV